MAEDEEPRATSIAERIAALKLSTPAGNIPVQTSSSTHDRTSERTGPTGHRARPPPPPPPVRPSVPAARPDRNLTSSVPPSHDTPPTTCGRIGNQPEAPKSVANPSSRPPLPVRTSTQSSQLSHPPPLPSRAPAPGLPPRRPSEAPSQQSLRSRRGSTESTSSVATARSAVSALSNGERYAVRAPQYDPSSLPALPPKRTQEERDADVAKYNGVGRGLRSTKSSPKIAQLTQGTTPPPLPASRQSSVSVSTFPSPKAIEPAPQQARPPPPPPPARNQPPPPPHRVQPAEPPRPKRSALSMGFNNKPVEPIPVRESFTPVNGVPPPIPAASKPNLAALQASKPRINGGATPVHTPSGPIAISSYAQFSQILSSHRIVVSDFYADWCGPCREFAPDYERLSKEYSRPNQIAFIKINTDHNQDLAQAYEIDCWPTLIIFDGGVEVEKYRGASEDGIKYTVGNVARQAGINLTAPSRQSAAIVPSAAPPGPSCLHCRDFSAPDNHAAKFPRESIPSHDIGWLAHQLTSPFPSPTDKARAIFTWLHHNVAYNVQAFFSGNVKSSTPQGTFQTGLAVCEGYAGLFAALAVKAGLEAIVIGGHGKGFGHAPLQPGQPIPPEDVGGHAWNAVKIDHAEWKLLDACWGAGNVRGDQTYEKSFKPERFTQSNDDFGLDHYPADSTKQFRSDGRVVSWPEYMTGNENGCGAQFFSGYVAEEGLSKTSFRPYDSPIVLVHQGPTTRFSFHRICPHWDPVRNGKGPPFLFVLFIEAQEGQSENHIPFETNGSVWWCDVPTSLLGGKGQSVSLGVLTTFGGNDGRGLRIEEYRQKKGRAGWSSGFVCRWEVA